MNSVRSSGGNKKKVFANLPLSPFIRWPTTERSFITATTYFSKAFSGSIRHVNFQPTKGIQILLYSWCPMRWGTTSYSWISIMDNFSSCSDESIFNFLFSESSEILFTTLQHSFFISAVFFAFKKIFVYFFSSFRNSFGNCKCVNCTT